MSEENQKQERTGRAVAFVLIGLVCVLSGMFGWRACHEEKPPSDKTDATNSVISMSNVVTLKIKTNAP